jgi:hypothetical protein
LEAHPGVPGERDYDVEALVALEVKEGATDDLDSVLLGFVESVNFGRIRQNGDAAEARTLSLEFLD